MKLIERWAAVPGYERSYLISSFGRVLSKKRIVASRDSYRLISERVMKPKNNGANYLFVTLCDKGNRDNMYIHRLVAMAFIDNPENKPYVNHMDGNPLNNDVSNLVWATHSENVLHGYRTGLNTNCRSKHHASVSIIDNRVGIKFPTIKAFCEHYGINYSTGRNFLNGYSAIPKVIDLTLESLKKMKNEKTINTK